MSKHSLSVSSFPPLRPPFLMIVAGEKGGVGKSLVSLALADLFRLHELRLDVLQIDAQQRLSRSLGRELTTIRVDHKLARRDPAAAARAYTPLYTAIETIPTNRGSVLVDVGANEAAGLAQWLGLVDLADDIAEWNIPVLIVVPYVAEAEAIRQASTTIKLLAEHLPQARLLLVENQRDGVVGDLHPESDAAAVHAKLIAPLRRTASAVVMPLIEAGSWRPFEATGCRLIDVVSMSVEDVQRVTGLPRPEAKIVRGDVAAWFSVMLDGLSGVIAFDGTVAEVAQ